MRVWQIRLLAGVMLLFGTSLALLAWGGPALPAAAAAVDVRFERAPVHDVLRVLAEAEGINLIIDQDVACHVSMDAQSLAGNEAIELVAGVCGLYLEKVGNTLVVSSEPKGLVDKVARAAPQRLKFTDNPVGEVLEALADLAGWNLISAVPLNREVTAWLDGMEHIEALRLVAAAAGLNYQLVDRVLYVKGTVEDGQEEQVVIYRLDHVEPGRAKELVEIFVPGARAEADQATRSLIVSGPGPRLDEVAHFINQFDTARAQVLVEARILEVSVDDLQSMGAEWPTTLSFDGSGTPSAFALTWDPAQLQATLRSLAERGRSKVLASPKISAVDGEEARMLIGDRVPIVTEHRDQEGRVFETVEYLDVGIALEIEPSIAADGLVTLDIRTEVSSVADPASRFPVVRTREATSRVRVRDGQPLIIGGLIQEEERERMNGIPLLSDLPLLGALFGRRVTESVQTETIIILVPYIVNEGSAGSAAEQSDGTRTGIQAAAGVAALGSASEGTAAMGTSAALASLEAPVRSRWEQSSGLRSVSFDSMSLTDRATEVQFEKERGRTGLISRLYAAADGMGGIAWAVGAGVRFYTGEPGPPERVRPWIDVAAEYATPLDDDSFVLYSAGAGLRLPVGDKGLLELYARHQEPSNPDPDALVGFPGRMQVNWLGLKLGWRY